MTRFEMLEAARKYLKVNSFDDVQLKFFHNDHLTLFLTDVMVGFAKKMVEKQKLK